MKIFRHYKIFLQEGGVTQPSHAYQPAVISRQEPGSHTVINNTSPALVAQALSGTDISSILIGPAPTILRSHWSRALEW